MTTIHEAIELFNATFVASLARMSDDELREFEAGHAAAVKRWEAGRPRKESNDFTADYLDAIQAIRELGQRNTDAIAAELARRAKS